MLDKIAAHLPAGIAGSIIATLVAIICALAGLVLLRTVRQRLFSSSLTDRTLAAYGGMLGAALLVCSVMAFAIALRAEERGWIIALTCVFLLGGGVGAAELISRYKDNPLRALLTAPGFFYVMLNAAGSAAALYLIYIFRSQLGFVEKASDPWPSDPGALVKAVLLAGSSSLVFFRSAIFKFRVGDSDLAIGPSIVLDTLLTAADRAVDRVMAAPRAIFVHDLMKDIAFEKAAVILPQHCVSLMQNVASEESQRIVSIVNKLRADKESPNKIKTLNLGLALLSIVGEKVLRTAVDSLLEDLQELDRQATGRRRQRDAPGLLRAGAAYSADLLFCLVAEPNRRGRHAEVAGRSEGPRRAFAGGGAGSVQMPLSRHPAGADHRWQDPAESRRRSGRFHRDSVTAFTSSVACRRQRNSR